MKKRNVASAKTRWEKSDRTTPEALVAMVLEGNRGALVKLGAQTDFVTKNSIFQEAARGKEQPYRYVFYRDL